MIDSYTRQIGDLEIQVLPEQCIGSSACVHTAPEVFQLNDQKISEPTTDGSDSEENILLAAQSCPTAAIVIRKKGKQVWPE